MARLAGVAAAAVCLCLLVLQAAASSPPDRPDKTTPQIPAGASLRNVISELTADLDLDSTDRETLIRFYTRLHRTMYRNQLLPLSKMAGADRGPPLDRIPAAEFLARSSPLVPPKAKCLEWQAPQTGYAASVPNCGEVWDITYGKEASVDRGRRSAVADLDQPDTHIFNAEFDLIICTFVFGHVKSPVTAAKNLFHWLKPGGHVFFTVNFVSGAPRIPQSHSFDNFRITVDGSEEVFRRAGFVVRESFMGGDPLIATAFLMGWGGHDLSQEELASNAALHKPWVSTEHSLPGDGIYLISATVLVKTDPRHG